MVDRESLSAAYEALGMEKPDGAPAAPTARKAAAPQGLGAFGRSFPGWERALAAAAPAAAGGAAFTGGSRAAFAGGDNKAQLSALLRELHAARRRLAEYESATFTPHEQRMFARHGLDPQRLSFMKTLSGFRKGMELESRLLDEALGGRLAPLAPAEEEDVSQYA